VSALVLMVSQPSDVLEVYEVGANAVRPTALNVALSVNFPSCAYSVRIRVGDRIWKRALPDVTDAVRWLVGASADASPVPVTIMAARLLTRAMTVRHLRRNRVVRNADLLLMDSSVLKRARGPS
jgi:hypothetical protein